MCVNKKILQMYSVASIMKNCETIQRIDRWHLDDVFLDEGISNYGTSLKNSILL